MRIHQDERKYLCPECGYKCKWINQLKYHMTKHSGTYNIFLWNDMNVYYTKYL